MQNKWLQQKSLRNQRKKQNRSKLTEANNFYSLEETVTSFFSYRNADLETNWFLCDIFQCFYLKFKIRVFGACCKNQRENNSNQLSYSKPWIHLALAFVTQRVKLWTMAAQRRKRMIKVIKMRKRKKEHHRCPSIVPHSWFYVWKKHSRKSDSRERNDSEC